MIRPFSAHLSLRTKFIIFIGAIISAFYLFMLYRTAVFDEKMILKQAEQQARMLYKQILLTRQWAADHNGLFVLQQKGVEANPYLDLPEVTDALGQTYYLRNPAMITRELSEYAKKDGLGHFRVTSLQPVNPANGPDTFEKAALQAFAEGADEIIDVDETDLGRVVRFIAPLRVSESCLGCHARHGYASGDIRGGLSITIPINWAHELIRRNINSLIFIGIASILLVTVALFLMFESLIVHRISRLSQAMNSFPADPPEQYLLPSVFRDELDSVSDTFVLFCGRLKKSQEELLKTKAQTHLSEKMASLGILTAGIAHEINNPLGGMLNCVKSMRENPGDRELVERYLPLLDKGLRQIETIMRQLLNFGRTEPLNIRKVNLQMLFDECTVLLAYKLKNIRLDTTIAAPGEYLLDAEALKQIIINIGLNAIQAMPDGGQLTIRCQESEGQLLLVFHDTGIGISAENMPHIFDPFFTTKGVGEGTGLGLAVTYTLVQRMHGKITVESSPGQGTEFTITIPVAESLPTAGGGPARATSRQITATAPSPLERTANGKDTAR
jgi:two-component system, NtrC family, sensor kinase